MRIRSIKPEYWTSPDVAGLSRDARLLFIGTWSVADDHGYLEDDPGRLLLQLFPGDRELDQGDVERWLDELVERDMLLRLEDAEGRRLLRVAAWSRHQRIDRPSKSRYAVPEGKTQPALAPDLATREPAPIIGEAKGTRSRRKRKADPDQLPDDFPEALAAFVEPVREVLVAIGEGNGARSVVVPTPRAVAMALADFPHRDFLRVARDYRAWQLGDACRSPHRDPVKGYRNQLDRAPDVLRPEQPGQKPGAASRDRDREKTERALRELDA